MSLVKKELLVNYKVIEDVYEYRDIDPEISEVYAYFEKSFQELYKSYARLFNINNFCFYIKSNNNVMPLRQREKVII